MPRQVISADQIGGSIYKQRWQQRCMEGEGGGLMRRHFVVCNVMHLSCVLMYMCVVFVSPRE